MDRDRQILESLYVARCLTSAQIDCLHFGAPSLDNTGAKPTRCHKRLRALFDYGYVARMEQAQKLSDGRKPLVYCLDQLGRQIATQLILDRELTEGGTETTNLSPLFLEHLLAVSDVHVAVVRAARVQGWSISHWRGEHLLRHQHLKAVVAMSGAQGRSGRAAIVPDAYFRLVTSRDAYNFFVEVDRGTETVDATVIGANDWKRKITTYLSYVESGLYEKQYGTTDIRVLTVVASQRRLQSLKAATEAVGGFDRFWFCVADDLTAKDIVCDAVWAVAGHDEVFPMVATE